MQIVTNGRSCSLGDLLPTVKVESDIIIKLANFEAEERTRVHEKSA